MWWLVLPFDLRTLIHPCDSCIFMCWDVAVRLLNKWLYFSENTFTTCPIVSLISLITCWFISFISFITLLNVLRPSAIAPSNLTTAALSALLSLGREFLLNVSPLETLVTAWVASVMSGCGSMWIYFTCWNFILCILFSIGCTTFIYDSQLFLICHTPSSTSCLNSASSTVLFVEFHHPFYMKFQGVIFADKVFLWQVSLVRLSVTSRSFRGACFALGYDVINIPYNFCIIFPYAVCSPLC